MTTPDLVDYFTVPGGYLGWINTISLAKGRWEMASICWHVRLVTFIDQNKRVLGLNTFQSLNDLPRHGSHIGSAMTLDLCHVRQATHTEPVKLAIQCSGNRFANRSLSHT